VRPDWEKDGVRLYCGDCLEVLPTLEAGSVRLLWTDPPFGHKNADGDFLSRRADIMRDGNGTIQSPIANDDQDSMRAVVDGMLRLSVPLLCEDCCCCCCCGGGGGGGGPTFAWVADRMDRDGLSFFHSVIWDKKNPGIGWRFRRQHEMVMVAHKDGGKLAWVDSKASQRNIISISKPRLKNHPNEKPLGLVEIFLRLTTSTEDLVLDPFMGSGTTGVACVKAGRKFIGIEKEPKYFEIAVKRIKEAFDSIGLFREGR
jgi:site-specific DNA-methyltransferase (adenine-specific)